MGKFRNKIIEYICIGAFAIMVSVTVVNVLARFIFSRSFSSAEEIAYLCFNWSVFFGACILYKNMGLISIDIVVDRLNAGAQRIVKIFMFIVIALADIVVFYLCCKLSIEAWVRPTPALRLPYTFIDLAPTIAFAIMAYDSVRFLIKTLKNGPAAGDGSGLSSV